MLPAGSESLNVKIYGDPEIGNLGVMVRQTEEPLARRVDAWRQEENKNGDGRPPILHLMPPSLFAPDRQYSIAKHPRHALVPCSCSCKAALVCEKRRIILRRRDEIQHKESVPDINAAQSFVWCQGISAGIVLHCSCSR